MNLHESNKFKMYTSTKEELDRYKPRVDTLPALATGTLRLGEGMIRIGDMDKKFTLKSTKQGEAKQNVRNALVQKAYMIASNISAFAHDTGNDDLKEKTRVSEYGLRELRDAELLTKSRIFCDLAEENIEHLASYGVKPADRSELEQLIEAFLVANRNMGAGKADRSSARTSLTDYFDEVDALLENVIDKLMENFRSSDPEFYHAYRAARVIYDIGGGHSAAVPPPVPAPATVPAR